MASQITNYKCPNCTAPIHFSPGSGKVTCDFCGSTFEVSAIEAMYRDQDEEAAESFRDEQRASSEGADTDLSTMYGGTAAEDSGTWDASGLSTDWGEDGDNMLAYSCPSCGAGLLCEKNTAATSCPYCGSKTIVPGQLSGALKPDYIIPFKLSTEQAGECLRNFCKSKFLLSKKFVKDHYIKEMKGVYVPFWLFDGSASGTATYNAQIREVHEHRKYTEYITHHYRVLRSGSINFEKVPTDASRKMPDDIMDSLEPFDYREIRPFSTAYLPGYLADRYDVSIDENSPRADKRSRRTLLDSLRSTVTGYTSVSIATQNVAVKRGRVYYAMFPVYMLRTEYKDKDYIFAINGQTGKTVGGLPMDKVRASVAGAIGYVIGALLTFMVLKFLA